jgi:predicted histidine transporter YuiF (NhaC family)
VTEDKDDEGSSYWNHQPPSLTEQVSAFHSQVAFDMQQLQESVKEIRDHLLFNTNHGDIVGWLRLIAIFLMIIVGLLIGLGIGLNKRFPLI